MTDQHKPRLDLVGEDGNAFFIIARARRALRKASYPQKKIDEFTKEAKSGNYDHVLQTCMEWFDVDPE